MVKHLMILPFAFVIFFYSCRSTKKIQTAITPKDTAVVVADLPVINAGEDSVKFIRENFNRVNSNRIGFTTFSANG